MSIGIDSIRPVIQEETTGCGIAAAANILGKTYGEMKVAANAMGIHAEDESLWSETRHVRALLLSKGVQTSDSEVPFDSWEALPDLALLAINHHSIDGKMFWHWVVFMRLDGSMFVLDSAAHLASNIRTDFENMQPKWFIAVERASLAAP